MPGYDIDEESCPSHKFVSEPFNAVLFVAGSLILVHSRWMAILNSVLAVAVYLLSTAEFWKVYAVAAWKDLPAWEVSEADVTDFLILGLVRWVSSVFYSGSVVRLLCSDFSKPRWFVGMILGCTVFIFWLRFCTGGAEWDMLQQVSCDKSVNYYFILSQLGECFRVAFQGLYNIS